MSTAGGEPQLCADCTADAAGALTFELTGAEATALVLKRRGTGDRVTLDFTAVDGGRLRSVLSAGAELREGRWDAFADCGDSGLRRLEPGLRDLRALVDRAPRPVAGTVVARVPYRTADGKLALRCWSRSPHAEAGALTVEDAALTVRGQLYGPRIGPGAVVEARLRGTPGRLHREPATDEGGGTFRCLLPYGPLAGGGLDGSQLWDLWLLPDGADGAEIRISRILDDMADRKSVFVYPASHFGAGAEPAVRAAPYYTVDNDLSLRLDPQES
ncbi:transferase [Streptomyces sp. NBC_00344]|uniref:transferase n=1 Tax=Streptomyces sp. NBC_00344 TaxID=2975720 RepID=UPI002E223173